MFRAAFLCGRPECGQPISAILHRGMHQKSRVLHLLTEPLRRGGRESPRRRGLLPCLTCVAHGGPRSSLSLAGDADAWCVAGTVAAALRARLASPPPAARHRPLARLLPPVLAADCASLFDLVILAAPRLAMLHLHTSGMLRSCSPYFMIPCAHAGHSRTST